MASPIGYKDSSIGGDDTPDKFDETSSEADFRVAIPKMIPEKI